MTDQKDIDYWEENGIEKPQQVVVCAACTHFGVVICGARHWDSVMRNQFRLIYGDTAIPVGWDEGFIDQFGEYLTREQAAIIAEKAGQLNTRREKGWPEHMLFSEDLY